MKNKVILISSIFSIFLIWIVIHLAINNPLLFPSPLEVIKAFFNLFTIPKYLEATLFTILRLIISLLAAFLIGTLLGVLAAKKSGVKTYLTPFITILRTIPVLSVIVFVLIIAGLELAPYIISFLMIFPIVYQGTLDSISNIDQAYLDIYKLEDDSFFRGMIYCYFPLTKNQFFTSIMQSLGLGIKVIVMAEYLSQTPNSIGNELYLAKTYLEYNYVFGWTLLLIIISLGLELITNIVKRREQNIEK